MVYAGADPLTSKPRYIRETHKTHAAAEKALTRLQGQVDEDRHPPVQSPHRRPARPAPVAG